MVRHTGGTIGTCEQDNLIAKLYPPADTFVIAVKTPGVYKRGTVLSLESDGSYEVLGSGSGTASAVLADDTLEEDETAVAYRSGHFNRNALLMAEGHTLTAAEENALRLAGIFLSDSMEMLTPPLELEEDESAEASGGGTGGSGGGESGGDGGGESGGDGGTG